MFLSRFSYVDRSEPNTGPAIDSLLRNAKSTAQDSEAIHPLFSANRWFLAQKVREDLSRGVHVIADRYSFSGIAYALAKGLDKSWVCAPELCLPKPDVALFFDIAPAVAATRGGYGNEVLERTTFQHAVYGHMKRIFNESYCQVRRLTNSFALLMYDFRTLMPAKPSSKCTRASPRKSR